MQRHTICLPASLQNPRIFSFRERFLIFETPPEGKTAESQPTLQEAKPRFTQDDLISPDKKLKNIVDDKVKKLDYTWGYHSGADDKDKANLEKMQAWEKQGEKNEDAEEKKLMGEFLKEADGLKTKADGGIKGLTAEKQKDDKEVNAIVSRVIEEFLQTVEQKISAANRDAQTAYAGQETQMANAQSEEYSRETESILSLPKQQRINKFKELLVKRLSLETAGLSTEEVASWVDNTIGNSDWKDEKKFAEKLKNLVESAIPTKDEQKDASLYLTTRGMKDPDTNLCYLFAMRFEVKGPNNVCLIDGKTKADENQILHFLRISGATRFDESGNLKPLTDLPEATKTMLGQTVALKEAALMQVREGLKQLGIKMDKNSGYLENMPDFATFLGYIIKIMTGDGNAMNELMDDMESNRLAKLFGKGEKSGTEITFKGAGLTDKDKDKLGKDESKGLRKMLVMKLMKSNDNRTLIASGEEISDNKFASGVLTLTIKKAGEIRPAQTEAERKNAEILEKLVQKISGDSAQLTGNLNAVIAFIKSPEQRPQSLLAIEGVTKETAQKSLVKILQKTDLFVSITPPLELKDAFTKEQKEELRTYFESSGKSQLKDMKGKLFEISFDSVKHALVFTQETTTVEITYTPPATPQANSK